MFCAIQNPLPLVTLGWRGRIGVVTKNVETVRAAYRHFSVGDVPAILELLSEDVRWDDFPDNSAAKAEVPWKIPRRGREEVAAYFQLLADTVEIQELQLVSLMAGGPQVAVEIFLSFKVKSGLIVTNEEVHLWTFDDAGKVERYRQFVDTAKYLEAARASR